MAKQLDWISLNLNGSETDPASATFTYCVKDSVDESMKKTATYLPGSPDFGQTLNSFWDAHVAAIKAAEGIV